MVTKENCRSKETITEITHIKPNPIPLNMLNGCCIKISLAKVSPNDFGDSAWL